MLERAKQVATCACLGDDDVRMKFRRVQHYLGECASTVCRFGLLSRQIVVQQWSTSQQGYMQEKRWPYCCQSSSRLSS